MTTKAVAQDTIRAFKANIGQRVSDLLASRAASGVLGCTYNYVNDGFAPGAPGITLLITGLQNVGWTVVDDGVSTLTIS